jgi:hypothetical protein
MSTLNIYRDAFTNKYDTIHEDENKPIKDIVNDNLDNAVIFVDGFERDKNYILKNDELCTIRVFPNDKAGNSGLEKFLGVITLGLYTLVDHIVATATGKTILDHAKEGLIKWLASDQDSAQQPDELQSIPQLRGAKNQSAYDKPFPFVMGKHLFTPYYIGKPYTTIGGEDGEDQYFHALFLLGYSRLKVTDIRIGEADLCSNKTGGPNGDGVYDGNPTPDNKLFMDAENP